MEKYGWSTRPFRLDWRLETCRKPIFLASDAPLVLWRPETPEDAYRGFGLEGAGADELLRRRGRARWHGELVANPSTLACVGRLRNLVAVDQAVAVILRHE